MGDRLRAGIPPWYVTKPTKSTQRCIPLGSLNRVPALIGWGKGGNVTSAGWQVTLCDPIWHVSSRSGEACCELLYPVTLLTYLLLKQVIYAKTVRDSVNLYQQIQHATFRDDIKTFHSEVAAHSESL